VSNTSGADDVAAWFEPMVNAAVKDSYPEPHVRQTLDIQKELGRAGNYVLASRHRGGAGRGRKPEVTKEEAFAAGVQAALSWVLGYQDTLLKPRA
jgi:hypothetical protein